ncbi:MAG: hypothetical protein AB1705_14200 [Verrucomicrobiota bacterium]
MNLAIPQINLVLAWLWVFLGFASGMFLGANFHKENWLGGYGSFRRRLYRLCHISFFGLGAVNLMFYFTVAGMTAAGAVLNFAAWGFILGAITMPLCCILMAHFPQVRLLFAVPVFSLLIAGTLTLWEVTKL